MMPVAVLPDIIDEYELIIGFEALANWDPKFDLEIGTAKFRDGPFAQCVSNLQKIDENGQIKVDATGVNCKERIEFSSQRT